MNKNNDTLISFDTETTGFIPGVNSIIALGAVAYRDGKEISHFYGAMKEWPGSVRNPSTTEWWKKHQAELKRIMKIWEEPEIIMPRFYQWAKSLQEPRTLAANPACFDSALLWWYMHRYCGENSIMELFKRHRALDIRTYIAAVMNVPYSQAERMILPREWAENEMITHNALEDARQQGVVLMNLMKANAGEL
jgi:DNA polymerase III alpha subunit (gram-positive type)